MVDFKNLFKPEDFSGIRTGEVICIRAQHIINEAIEKSEKLYGMKLTNIGVGPKYAPVWYPIASQGPTTNDTHYAIIIGEIEKSKKCEHEVQHFCSHWMGGLETGPKSEIYSSHWSSCKKCNKRLKVTFTEVDE